MNISLKTSFAIISLSCSAFCFGQEATAPAENTAAAPATTAGGFSCTSSGMTRTVEVGYDTPGAKVPCKVNYTKVTEAPGATTALYSAISEEGFCENKMAAFVEKLTASGWSCAPVK